MKLTSIDDNNGSAIPFQVYPSASLNALLVKYGPSTAGVGIWQEGLDVRVEVPERGAASVVTGDILRTTTSPLTVDQWNYVAVTYNFTSGDLKIYVNNAEVGSGNIGMRAVASEDNVKLGSSYAGSFQGSVSCLQIYDTVFTAQEITDSEQCNDHISKYRM